MSNHGNSFKKMLFITSNKTDVLKILQTVFTLITTFASLLLLICSVSKIQTIKKTWKKKIDFFEIQKREYLLN